MEEKLNEYEMEMDPRLALMLKNNKRFRKNLEEIYGSTISILDSGSISENKPAMAFIESVETVETITRGLKRFTEGYRLEGITETTTRTLPDNTAS